MPTATETNSPLDKLTEPLWGYPEMSLERVYGRNLLLNESAKVRLAATCGWLLGLSKSDPENANRIAKDLDRQLTFLSNYGGPSETFMEGLQDGSRPLPRFKVMLYDDGCFGSFAIGWYQIVPYEAITKLASSKMPDWWANCSRPRDISEEQTDALWYAALSEAFQHFKVREQKWFDDPMTERRLKPPTYEGQDALCRTESFLYGFSFNGGLILHNPDKPEHASYGVHT